jgi:SAM-dependent methyltransferase
VGTGRIAVPLAAAGHDITGVDNDAAMLDRARTAWAKVRAEEGSAGRTGALTLVEHDLTTLDLRTRFGVVILALNSLLLLDGRAAQEDALKVMRAHLAPGGHAVIDVWLPTSEDLELYDGRQLLDWIRTDPETDERVAKTSTGHFDATTRRAVLSTAFEAERDGVSRTTTREDAISFLGAAELFDLVASAGLTPESVLGDYSGTAWSDASERVVLICGAA